VHPNYLSAEKKRGEVVFWVLKENTLMIKKIRQGRWGRK